jgi:hypothetical protein
MGTKTLTRSELVVKALRAARRGKFTIDGKTVKTTGGWVPGYLLCHPSVGGSEGLRRLRELRSNGLTVEMKKIPQSSAYQYRIAK